MVEVLADEEFLLNPDDLGEDVEDVEEDTAKGKNMCSSDTT